MAEQCVRQVRTLRQMLSSVTAWSCVCPCRLVSVLQYPWREYRPSLEQQLEEQRRHTQALADEQRTGQQEMERRLLANIQSSTLDVERRENRLVACVEEIQRKLHEMTVRGMPSQEVRLWDR